MKAVVAACAMFFLLLASGFAGGQQTGPAAAGAALFQRSCASCHNVEGRAPSLATGVFAHGSDDAQIAQTIRAGVPGTQMPPFPALSADEIRQLVAYIRSLSAGSPIPAPIPAPNPARGRTPDPAPDPAPAPALTFERLRHAANEPHNWLTYWGDYQGIHYSRLNQITADNARRLQAAWARQ